MRLAADLQSTPPLHAFALEFPRKFAQKMFSTRPSQTPTTREADPLGPSRQRHELVERARPRDCAVDVEVSSIHDTFLRVGFRSDWRAAPRTFGFTFVYLR